MNLYLKLLLKFYCKGKTSLTSWMLFSVKKLYIELAQRHSGWVRVLHFYDMGLAGPDPRCGSIQMLIKPCCGSVPHTKWRMIGTDVSSGTIFLRQKEENWQWILVWGQSSSPCKTKTKKKKCTLSPYPKKRIIWACLSWFYHKQHASHKPKVLKFLSKNLLMYLFLNDFNIIMSQYNQKK